MRVKIVNNDFQVIQMFRMNQGKGYSVIMNDISTRPDLIVFTGGSDVDPELYGEKMLPRTHIDRQRDDREMEIYNRYIDVPKVGICRGGQFLNVMNAGAMWQDVDNHGLSFGHAMVNLLPGLSDFSMGKEFYVTSTHHQMMIPHENGVVIGIAEGSDKKSGIATKYISAIERPIPKFDTEVVWYEKTKSLCFQPHPEYRNGSDCQKYFFNLLEHFFK